MIDYETVVTFDKVLQIPIPTKKFCCSVEKTEVREGKYFERQKVKSQIFLLHNETARGPSTQDVEVHMQRVEQMDCSLIRYGALILANALENPPNACY